MVIGTIILGSSYTRAQFLVGRVVTGFGNGINSSSVPTYQSGKLTPSKSNRKDQLLDQFLVYLQDRLLGQLLMQLEYSEMARPERRGRLLSAQGTVTILGLCIAYWLDYGFSFIDSTVQWRFPISFQAFFAVCLVLQMIPLPDTPRWLCEQDRSDEAGRVLAHLQLEQPADESTPEVVQLRRQIESAIEIESAGGPFKYKELLAGGKVQNLRRIILACTVNLMQQFTGNSF